MEEWWDKDGWGWTFTQQLRGFLVALWSTSFQAYWWFKAIRYPCALQYASYLCAVEQSAAKPPCGLRWKHYRGWGLWALPEVAWWSLLNYDWAGASRKFSQSIRRDAQRCGWRMHNRARKFTHGSCHTGNRSWPEHVGILDANELVLPGRLRLSFLPFQQ